MYFRKLTRWRTIWLILLLMVIFTIIPRQILTYGVDYSYLQMLLIFSMLDIHSMDYVYSGYGISSGASYLHPSDLLMILTSCSCYMDSASLLFKSPFSFSFCYQRKAPFTGLAMKSFATGFAHLP